MVTFKLPSPLSLSLSKPPLPLMSARSKQDNFYLKSLYCNTVGETKEKGFVENLKNIFDTSTMKIIPCFCTQTITFYLPPSPALQLKGQEPQ